MGFCGQSPVCGGTAKATPNNIEVQSKSTDPRQVFKDSKKRWRSYEELCTFSSEGNEPNYNQNLIRDFSYSNHIVVQSEEFTTSSGDNEETQETIGFADENSGTMTTMSAPKISYSMDSKTSIRMDGFLERPVLIDSYTWTEATTFNSSVDPWFAFFNNPIIKRKLDNYYLIRCKLHLKIVVNASPFYYGAVLFAYTPTPNNVVENFIPAFEAIQLSQRPHMWVYPQNNQGAELECPFFFQQNWLDATSQAALQDIGTLRGISTGVLRNANSVAGSAVDIQLYAWATEVEVAGSTQSLAVQSGEDEYDQSGPISKVASAVARYSGKLDQIPIIGPFAKATSMIGSTVANVASIFGYTRVPNIDTVNFYRPNPLPHFASTDIGEPIEKLTLDARNDLCIDSRPLGLDKGDELSMRSILTKESYLTSFEWTSTRVYDDDLFNMSISPNLVRVTAGVSQDLVAFTPMAYISKLFEYWRGDIIVRFKFICSQYHKGRVSIHWDPLLSNFGTSISSLTSSTATQVVDLAEETDVEFRIPYTQATAYLDNYAYLIDDNYYSTSAGVPVTPVDNGNLLVKVLNAQTSPVATSDIRVNVFVRGAENLEFAAPHNFNNVIYSPYTVQSSEYQLETPSSHVMGGESSQADESINLVYMGETVTSMRPMMQRVSKYYTFVPSTRTANENVIDFTIIRSRANMYPGFDPSGFDSAIGAISGVPQNFNYVNWTIPAWMSLMFAGQRGSISYYCRPGRNSERAGSLEMGRTQLAPQSITQDYATTNSNVVAANNCNGTGFAGIAITHPSSNATVSANFPFYSQEKFLGNDPLLRNIGYSDGTMYARYVSCFGGTGQSPIIEMYTKAGQDFNLIFNIGAPVLYKYAPPTPA
jgi:hypothetical protein